MASQLEKVTAEILSRVEEKYILTLRPGCEHLSADELAGIIAIGLDLQAQKTLKLEIDTEDLAKTLAEIRRRIVAALTPPRGRAN
jgi:hypothetical protein